MSASASSTRLPSSTLSGTNSNDSFVIRRHSEDALLEFFLNDALILKINPQSTTSVELNGLEGDDTFTIDYTNGFFTTPLTLNGNKEFSPLGDSLIITSNKLQPLHSSTYKTLPSSTEGKSGIIVNNFAMYNHTISFTGLEPIENLGPLAQLVIQGTQEPEPTTMYLIPGPPATGYDPVSGQWNQPTYQLNFGSMGYELYNFRNIDHVILNSLEGDDTIVVDLPNHLGDSLANIEINGGPGSDTMNLQATPAEVTTTINSGDGNDLINLGSAANDLSSLLGPIFLDGGLHLFSPTRTETVINTGASSSITLPLGDTLNIYDQGYVYGTPHYSLSEISFFVDLDFARTSYSGIESINLYCGQGTNDISISALSSQTHTNIVSQAASDTFNILSTGNLAALVLSSGGGNDFFTIDSTNQNSILIVHAGEANDIMTCRGTGLASGVNLNGESGEDILNLRSSGASSLVTLTGGLENDVFSLGSAGNQLQTLLGTIDIDGGLHSLLAPTVTASTSGNGIWPPVSQTLPVGDTITFSDQGSTLSAQYNITTTTFNLDKIKAQTVFSNLETFNLYTGQGSNNINISSTPSNVHLEVISLDGSDNTVVTSTGNGSILTLHEGNGSNVLQVLSTGTNSVSSFWGGEGKDNFSLGNSGAGSGVSFSGGLANDIFQFLASNTNSLTFADGGDGNDSFYLGSASNELSSLAGRFALVGGNHSTIGGSTSLSVQVNGTVRSKVFPGADSLHISDQGFPTAAQYNFSPDSFDRDATIAQTVYSGFESFSLNGSQGPNDINIINTDASTYSFVQSQESNDDIDITDLGPGSGLFLSSGGGNDTLDLKGSGSGSLSLLQSDHGDDTVAIQGTGPWSSLAVLTGGGNDSLSIETSDSKSIINLNGGSENDTFHFGKVSQLLSNLHGEMEINGESHQNLPANSAAISFPISSISQTIPVGDVLSLSDHNFGIPAQYNLSGTSVNRDSGIAQSTFQNIESIMLNSGSNFNDINIINTPSETWTEVISQNAEDDIDITLSGNGSVLQVKGEGGDDQIDIASTGDNSLIFVDSGSQNDIIRLNSSGFSAGVSLDGGNNIDSIHIARPTTFSLIKAFGGLDADTFSFSPPLSANQSIIDIDGQTPFYSTNSQGDKLTLDLSGIQSSAINWEVDGSGSFASQSFSTFGWREIEELQVIGGDSDFGDAQDPSYPTVLASNGASHLLSGLFLGSVIDSEPNGQPSITAKGDDQNAIPPFLNDEDGIFSLEDGLQPNFIKSVAVQSTGAGLLNGWVDFNFDGDWDDPGEQICLDVPLQRGVNYLSFPVPSQAAVGLAYARFRLNAAGGLFATGPVSDGEVEDYLVTIGNPELSVKQKNGPIIPDGYPVDFGTRTTGTLGEQKEFQIINTGTVALSVNVPIQVYGPDKNDFIISQQPYGIISASTKSSFFVEFRPQSNGPKSAWIEFTSNDINSPYQIFLTGRGEDFPWELFIPAFMPKQPL